MRNAPNCARFLAVLITLGVLQILLFPLLTLETLHYKTWRTEILTRINLPFKDQVSANAVQSQLRDLGNRISLTLQPVYVSKKLEQDLKPKDDVNC